MRREGLPIEGFCVAAGIPTTEKAAEIINGLNSVGIRHVAFKPGSVNGIRQVVNIALTRTTHTSLTLRSVPARSLPHSFPF
jgi:fatty acid synthase subunit alpha